MSTYELPPLPDPVTAEPGLVWTVASGDLRLTANQVCWPTQQRLEADLTAALNALGRWCRTGISRALGGR